MTTESHLMTQDHVDAFGLFIASIERRAAQLGGSSAIRAVVGSIYSNALADVMRHRPGYNYRASNWTMATPDDYLEATRIADRQLEPGRAEVDPHAHAVFGAGGFNITLVGYQAFAEAYNGSARLLVGMIADSGRGPAVWRVFMTREGEDLVSAGGYGVTHKNASRQCKTETAALESLKLLVGGWFGINAGVWREGSPPSAQTAVDGQMRAPLPPLDHSQGYGDPDRPWVTPTTTNLIG